jgi:hypothetical protein
MQLGTLLVVLFVGDLIPSPLAGFGTTLERIRKHFVRGDRLES